MAGVPHASRPRALGVGSRGADGRSPFGRFFPSLDLRYSPLKSFWRGVGGEDGPEILLRPGGSPWGGAEGHLRMLEHVVQEGGSWACPTCWWQAAWVWGSLWKPEYMRTLTHS